MASKIVSCLLVLVAFCVLTFGVVTSHPDDSRTKVAVVGAGIGGASFSYYLTQLFPSDSLLIDVYETNDYIGGRLKHTNIGGHAYDLGGDVWSSVNEYMVSLAQELDIPVDDTPINNSTGFGIYIGDQEWLRLQKYPADTALTAAATANFQVHLKLNYNLRGQRGTFETINEYLRKGGLDTYAAQRTDDYFDSLGVSEDFLNESVLPLTRTIYDQDMGLNAFAGFASILSASSSTYTTYGGNDVFVQTLFDNTNATVHLSTAVTEITKTKEGYDVGYENSKDKEASRSTSTTTYDIVVIAAPIEFTNIDIRGVKLPDIPQRTYVHWYVTLVVAEALNPDYFGRDPTPDNVYTTHNSTTVFVVVAIEGNDEMANDSKVYKIFSNGNVQGSVSAMFLGIQQVIVQHWPYTFPDLSPSKTNNATEFQPIVLDNGLYYLSGMESIAVAMECSVTSARNVALLIAQSSGL